MPKIRIVLLAAALAGCSSFSDFVPHCGPEGDPNCSAIRCTELHAQAAGYFTQSSGQGRTKQLTIHGDVPEQIATDPELLQKICE